MWETPSSDPGIVRVTLGIFPGRDESFATQRSTKPVCSSPQLFATR